MVKKIGLLGLSDGNGHPYSFSAIINGYNDEHLKKSSWEVIYRYIKKRDPSEMGFENIRITHVWTQEKEISQNLALACKIDHVLDKYEDMIGKVDAVIIARDDYENHLDMAKLYLEAGLKVFVDKPLTVDVQELLYFKDYLINGQLMSMSGMRYAIELDDIRSNLKDYGELKIIQSSVINDWEKYGIHLLDAVLGILPNSPVSIEYIKTTSDMYLLNFEDGLTWTINILGNAPKTFNINVWGITKRASFNIEDNFSMFRRMLWRFGQLVSQNEVYYRPHDTLVTLCLLIGGQISKKEERKVYLKEFNNILN
ncbi:Gfo/Idh/MocA family oxidoreductase [Psychrobacillus sp. FSL K6-4615]|uniref:Gfo/Idh/MocA family oxidoreductase n=1 Tax=Psychrobacillus sp. FSL K6-4615 TaxID=2921551 RepID=UPI0030F747D0